MLAQFVKAQSFSPFGQTREDYGEFYTLWGFTGQWLDSETGQYYLRARQYSPYLSRFTSYDPIMGKFDQPLTLHKYLYCGNEPLNMVDLTGRIFTPFGTGHNNDWQTQYILSAATEIVGTNIIVGPVHAFIWSNYFGPGAMFDYKYTKSTFAIGHSKLKGSEFGNYLAGYSCFYNFGMRGEAGVRGAGHGYAFGEWVNDALFSSGRKNLSPFDDPDSKYFLSAGLLKAHSETKSRKGLSYINAKFQLYYGLERAMSSDIGSNGFWDEMEMFTGFWNDAR
ncbi:MAG: RHS repeat-associated core domain-containing protein [Anaerohalosphaeraceae bacterium]|nr:RHS repeat-associated core domain-containing protein [Anaerohalosphaeraceae bacterium]